MKNTDVFVLFEKDFCSLSVAAYSSRRTSNSKAWKGLTQTVVPSIYEAQHVPVTLGIWKTYTGSIPDVVPQPTSWVPKSAWCSDWLLRINSLLTKQNQNVFANLTASPASLSSWERLIFLCRSYQTCALPGQRPSDLASLHFCKLWFDLNNFSWVLYNCWQHGHWLIILWDTRNSLLWFPAFKMFWSRLPLSLLYWVFHKCRYFLLFLFVYFPYLMLKYNI